MYQTSLLLIVFIAGFACLPWLVKWLQRRTGLGKLPLDGSTRLVSSLALSPQQRVVTVEVTQDNTCTRLVLGVTPQSITCLHVLPAGPVAGAGAPAAPELTPVLPGFKAQLGAQEEKL